MAQAAVRNPWQVTLHVWYALFLRELTARVTADRVAWLCLRLPIYYRYVLDSTLCRMEYMITLSGL